MNKNYLQYAALMMLFTFINPSFCMDNKKPAENGFSWQYIAMGAAYIFLPYLTRKTLAAQYDDVSPETKKWAQKVFQESGINDADGIPLKKGKYGDGWSARNDYFIVIPNGFDPLKCAYRQCLEEKAFFKHEVKHVQNYDGTKSRVLQVGTIAVGYNLAKEKPSMVVPFIPIGYGTNMAYWRYQESEADRFACEKATSVEELEVFRDFFLKDRKEVKDDLKELASDLPDLEERRKIFEENRNKLSYYDQLRGKTALIILEKLKDTDNIADTMMDIGEFVYDRKHPLSRHRAAMAQDYINKWDEKHKRA